MGGLNTIKSAATTVVKKIDEIKEAISATSTPVKLKDRDNKIPCGNSHDSLDSSTDGSQQDRNEMSIRLASKKHFIIIFFNFFYSQSNCTVLINCRHLRFIPGPQA